ncbi:protein FAM210B, mitochondrial-like [Dysidea avara]|uniref:protein FAM210B, mitochondrial-like n=1 Tax=Dysidea avara TaxID=196820 RepID=UPI003331F103
MLRLVCVNAKVIPTTISSRGLYYSSVLSNGTLNHCVTTTSRVSPSIRCVVGHQTLSRSLKIATPTIQQLTYANSPGIRSMNTQQEGEKKQQSFWQSITQIERVKQVLRDYGVVAVLFHTSMSLCVLGGMYTLVDHGVDVGKFLAYFGFHNTATKGLSTFAAAYILYKFTLPIRAMITISCVPLIVRTLRARGWIAQKIIKES